MTEQDVEVRLLGPVEAFGNREELEECLDRVMDHLLTCDVVDPSVSESYSNDGDTVALEFSMTIRTDEADQAVSRAMGAIRASFHGVGAATPGWEDVIRQMRSRVQATSGDTDLVDV